MKTAIIGLPMAGKTSLFTILTGVHQETRIGSTAARTGVAKVPDARLDALAQLSSRRKSPTPPSSTWTCLPFRRRTCATPATSRACAWWTPSRTCCACSRTRPCRTRKARWIPVRDLEDVETELILSDFVVVEKRMERLDKDRKKIKNPELDNEFELLQRCKAVLEANRPLRELEFDAEDEKRIRGFQFLSQKPMLYVLNLGEADAAQASRARTGISRRSAGRPRATPPSTAVCGKIEAELAELPREEQREYLASYGLQESGLERLISATYSLLGLMSFLTAGEDECRAWTIPMHSTAVKAAGAIHSDFEKKFIRAEVVNWKTLIDLGGYAGARDKGQLRLEGKEYIVKDGDVLVIRHS